MSGKHSLDDPAREAAKSHGPTVVTAGDPAAATVLVLDPGGLSPHEELPATWRELSEQRRIVWFRLPTDGALTEAAELLGDPAALGTPVDVVVSGDSAATASRVLRERPGAVRSLLLVDPPADFSDADAGYRVEVIARTEPGPRDRIPAPLPLGHPDVVSALVRTLTQLDSAD